MGNNYDFVIVGGGPAGLSAAIHATRNGFSALLLEQGEQLGPFPRGEGVRYYPLFDELLGKGYLEQISHVTPAGSTYHSPGDRAQVQLPTKGTHYFFEWRDFIDRLGERAVASGAELRTGCRVTGVIEQSGGRCAGVRYLDADGNEQTAEGTTVLGCDGHRSVIGRHYGIPYDDLSCPIMKVRLAGANFDPVETRDLQFYLVANGDLDYAPRFPPAVAYAFPLADQKMEVGLMLRMGRARNLAGVERPSVEELIDVWQRLKGSYPGFSRYFAGAEVELEAPTDLPNAALVTDNVPAAGAVLIGDSVAFVDPFGSSGIFFSMAMARIWVNAISRSLREVRGDAARLWTRRQRLAWQAEFRASRPFRQVRKNYLRVGALEWLIFRQLRTADRINRRWGLISRLMKLA